ncbi:hypothetical protein [Nocardioides sp. TF02-7]|uniref:hypothetical protein n=1 Tax=Nocardioides sp. TF02-7 TaxID=2917724 RepID=UPI001F06B616|nr:hypothetical protein [Nocardioides sp. TF02-7]UMG94526.1 hypothetical protein MF408_11475 [Nocardioides sp. TF02-7]
MHAAEVAALLHEPGEALGVAAAEGDAALQAAVDRGLVDVLVAGATAGVLGLR